MKKIISAGVAAAMIVPSAVVFADEAAQTAPVMLYNNQVIASDEFVPFITDGRTMLPFRYLLDEIGASVDYDEATRTVKAEKDGTRISFSLDDTYIDIIKGDAVKKINQDVRNEIKDDRVYVPIRFLSEAFGLDVGWDETNKTAILVDMGAYVKELEEKAPDFKRYMELASKLPESYTQTANLKLTMDYTNGTEKGSMDIGLDYDMSLNGGAASADVKADVALDMPEVIRLAKAIDLKGVEFSFRYNDGQFYAKTNLISKLKTAYPDNEKIQNAAILVNDNTWYKADIRELFKLLGIPEELVDVVKVSLKGGMTDEDFAKTMSVSQANQLTSVDEAAAIDMTFDMYAVMFKDAFTITENGEGSYDIKMAIDKDTLVDDIMSAGVSEDAKNTDEYKAAVADMKKALTFDCNANVTIRNNIPTESNVNIVIAVNDETKLNLKLEAASKLTPDTKKEITMPESALDLVNIIKLFK